MMADVKLPSERETIMKKQVRSGGKCRRYVFFAAVLCSIFLFGSAYARADELIVNGDFETDFTGWTLNFTPPNDAAVITTTPDRVFHGSKAVNFSNNSVPATAILSQTFNTVLGTQYNLRLAFGAVAWDDRYATLHFEILGAGGVSILDSFTLTRLGNNPAGGGQVNPAEWTTHSRFFTADGSSTTFRVTDVTSQSFACDALLDYVSIQPPPNIPTLSESGAIILMFLLLIVGTWYVRRIRLCE